MRVVLVNPPRSEHECEDIAPPLGLLLLARIAKEAGCEVVVEDANLLWHLSPHLQKDFYEEETERLLALEPDLLGFTSMAVDSGVALELARRVKERRPRTKVVLGGVHFSSIADHVRQRFPWVDAVITGEGENGFQEMLSNRRSGTLSVLNASPEHPRWPLYEAVSFEPYFYLNPTRTANIETGRGCKYRCRFCYSPSHHSGWRMFGADVVLEQMSILRDLGVKHLWAVEDNIGNDEEHLLALCRRMSQANLGLTWSCYLTARELKPALIEAMAEAGCTHIFSGIDAVGQTAEKVYSKAFLRGEMTLAAKLDFMRTCGIRPTCAFMLAPQSHPAAVDTQATVAAALNAHEHGAQVLLNCLTLFPGTVSRSAYSEFSYDPMQADWLLDCPSICVNNSFAVEAPTLFPFHARFVEADEWSDFILTSHCQATLVNVFPETMLALAAGGTHSFLQIARQISRSIKDLLEVPKPLRRHMEVEAARSVFSEILGPGLPQNLFSREENAYYGPDPRAQMVF